MPWEAVFGWFYPLDRRSGANTILRRMPENRHFPAADMDTLCKHPKVRVVAREEDVEFVECQDCGEVFDSDEFRDMAIEEEPDEDEDEEDSASKR